jgi:hypothetical protein
MVGYGTGGGLPNRGWKMLASVTALEATARALDREALTNAESSTAVPSAVLLGAATAGGAGGVHVRSWSAAQRDPGPALLPPVPEAPQRAGHPRAAAGLLVPAEFSSEVKAGEMRPLELLTSPGFCLTLRANPAA